MKNLVFTLALICTLAPVASPQSTGKLKTIITPSRAGIFVDGKYVGPAGNFGFSRTYDVPAGSHEILITEPRYQDITRQVTITAGKKLLLTEKMTLATPAQPPFGLLRVTGPDKFAAVFINGKYYGHVDEFSNFAQGMKLNPGDYELKVQPVNGAEHVEKFTITAEKTTLVAVK